VIPSLPPVNPDIPVSDSFGATPFRNTFDLPPQLDFIGK
jgi:hypothetical protein